MTATDYVINRSREELLEVSPINRDRFLNELEAVNSKLSTIKRTTLASAFIYSTHYSNTVIDGNEVDSFSISKLAEDSYTRGSIASVKLENDRSNSISFHSGYDMVMNVNASSRSTFYFAQVTLADQSDNDTETMIDKLTPQELRVYTAFQDPVIYPNTDKTFLKFITF